MIYRKVPPTLFVSEPFRSLPDSAQLLYLYLAYGPHSIVVPGLVPVGRLALAEARDVEPAEFDGTFAHLETCSLAFADWRARLIWLPAVLVDNPPQSKNTVTAWRRAFDLLPDCALKRGAADAITQMLTETFETGKLGNEPWLTTWQSSERRQARSAERMPSAMATEMPNAMATAMPTAMASPTQKQKQKQKQQQQQKQSAGAGKRVQGENQIAQPSAPATALRELGHWPTDEGIDGTAHAEARRSADATGQRGGEPGPPVKLAGLTDSASPATAAPLAAGHAGGAARTFVDDARALLRSKGLKV